MTREPQPQGVPECGRRAGCEVSCRASAEQPGAFEGVAAMPEVGPPLCPPAIAGGRRGEPGAGIDDRQQEPPKRMWRHGRLRAGCRPRTPYTSSETGWNVRCFLSAAASARAPSAVSSK